MALTVGPVIAARSFAPAFYQSAEPGQVRPRTSIRISVKGTTMAKYEPASDAPDDEYSRLGGSATDPLSQALSNAFRTVFERNKAAAAQAANFTRNSAGAPAEPDEFDRLGGGAQDPLSVAVRNAMRKVLAPAGNTSVAPTWRH